MMHVRVLIVTLVVALGASSLRAETTMYVANYGPFPTGSVVTVDPTSGSLATFAASGVQSPGAIAVDTAGFVYCANNATFNVTKLAPGGSSSVFASGFSGPSGLAFDRDGNLFVSNYYSSSMDKVTPAGVRSVFATGLGGPYMPAFGADGNLYVPSWDTGSVIQVTPAGVTST
ncbi:MAG: hypothetical protein ACKOEM_01350, partial [Planctomycetia bacterium]